MKRKKETTEGTLKNILMSRSYIIELVNLRDSDIKEYTLLSYS